MIDNFILLHKDSKPVMINLSNVTKILPRPDRSGSEITFNVIKEYNYPAVALVDEDFNEVKELIDPVKMSKPKLLAEEYLALRKDVLNHAVKIAGIAEVQTFEKFEKENPSGAVALIEKYKESLKLFPTKDDAKNYLYDNEMHKLLTR